MWTSGCGSVARLLSLGVPDLLAPLSRPEVELVERKEAYQGQTWRTIFNLILDLRTPDPLVFILDEFQYLADDRGIGGLASELNAAWKRRRPARPLLLVLSGSAVGTMEALATGGGPLYGRFAWQHRLHPFGYWDSATMTPLPSLRDQALSYGIFGGTPRYLAAVDAPQALAANVAREMLAPDGDVRLLVETALDQEFGLLDTSKYRAVLRAVADGCTGRNEIAQQTGLPNDQGLRDKFGRLVELGCVETRRNIDARPNEPVRNGIADPAFRFHQRFVVPELDKYMGLEFERIAVQAYDRRHDSLGLPLVTEWGRWEGADRERRSLAMLERAADAGRAWAHVTLEPASPLLYVSASGFTDDFREAIECDDREVICWSLADLYQA